MKFVKKSLLMGATSAPSQEDLKVHINMELEDDKEVGDEK
jgi:hypothetical protein